MKNALLALVGLALTAVVVVAPIVMAQPVTPTNGASNPVSGTTLSLSSTATATKFISSLSGNTGPVLTYALSQTTGVGFDTGTFSTTVSANGAEGWRFNGSTGNLDNSGCFRSTASATAAAFSSVAGAYYCFNSNTVCTTNARDVSGDLELLSANDFVRVEVGTGTGRAAVRGVLSVNTTGVGNVGASGPDDLQTYSLPANSLVTNGHCIKATAFGTTANNANAKTVRMTIGPGPTALVTKQLTASIAGRWKLEAVICRTGASTQDYSGEAVNFGGTTVSSTDGATVTLLSAFGAITETETNALTIKTQSTASTADNDVVSERLIVEFL